MANQPPRRPNQGNNSRHINRQDTPQRQQQRPQQMSAEQYAEYIRRQAAAKRKAQDKRRRMYMRRRIAFGILVLCVLAGLFFGVKLIIDNLSDKAPPNSQPQSQQMPNSTGSPQSNSQSTPASGSQDQPQSTPASSSTPEIADTSVFPVTTMVNANNPIPAGYVPETEKVDDAGHLFDTRAAAALKKMLADGNATGLKLMICSAYRSNARQTTLFNEMKDGYIAKGMSEQEAYDKTRTIRAIPGTSEHETALAADIVSVNYQTLDNGFEKTDEFKWLYKNCAEYGFILRYPSDKTAITGTIYEPWHYRYVGVEMAKEIMSQSICLEEYVELKK